jgi:hypothetical protein
MCDSLAYCVGYSYKISDGWCDIYGPGVQNGLSHPWQASAHSTTAIGGSDGRAGTVCVTRTDLPATPQPAAPPPPGPRPVAEPGTIRHPPGSPYHTAQAGTCLGPGNVPEVNMKCLSGKYARECSNSA